MRFTLFFLRRFFGRFELFKYDFLFMTVGLVLSISILTATMSIFEGYEKALKTLFLSTSEHFSIYNLNEDQAKKLSEFSEVQTIAELSTTTSVVFSKTNSRVVLIKAIDADKKLVFDLKNLLQEGSSYFSSNDKSEVIIGNLLANELLLEVGDNLFVSQGVDFAVSSMGIKPQKKQFKVVGIFSSGFEDQDKRVVYIKNKSLHSGFDNKTSYYGVKLHDQFLSTKPHLLATLWKSRLGENVVIKTWIDGNERLFRLLFFQKFMLFLVLLLLVLVASFGVVNSVASLVLEKKKEIAVFKIVGVSARQIKLLFLVRVLSVGFVSIVVAIFLGYLLSYILSVQPFYHLSKSVYLIERIQMDINFKMGLLIFVLSFLIVYLACLFSLKLIDRQELIRVIRNQ